jgi:Skp family chaperone for outer membrane proteins
MKFKLQIAAAAMLAICLVASYGQSSDTQPPVKKHVATKKAHTPEPVEVRKLRAPAEPSVADQIQELRHDLEGQINDLKTNLAVKDAQLQPAQAAAAKAQAAAEAQQQAVTDNTTAVTTLQTSVNDLKGNEVSLATTISDETSKIKKTEAELGPLASAKLRIGATVFADYSYWSDYDGSTAFVDNQTKPPSTKDENYNAFEVTRTYFNLLYTPSEAVSLRITPDIYRTSAVTAVTSTASPCTALPCTPTITNTYTTDQSLTFRLKYGYIDLNKLFAGNTYLKDTKITFGQTQNPLTDWEEGLTGHRYTYKMPMDFSSGLSSTYVGVRAHGPVKFNSKEYLDYDLGVYTNGSYSTTELSDTKQFMGRATWYPLGTKTDRTGLGATIFGGYGFTNVAPSSAFTGHYAMDRMVFMGHYQTADKGFLITGQYDLSDNVKANGVTQKGYAFEGNARLGGAKSLFHLFGLYQYYEPNSNVSTSNDSTKYSRTVGGIAYKFSKNLDIALTDSNYHYNKAAGKNDANAASIFTQYTF